MGDRKLRLFIADPDVDAVSRLRAASASADMIVLGATPSANAALSEIVTQHPDVLVLDDAACTGTPAEIVRRIVNAAPDVCVVVTGASGSAPSLMGRAVAAGARGFVLKPYAVEDLFGMIQEATSLPRTQATGPARPRARLISVYAPKGGAGATTVAVNLAVALAGSGSRRVGLIDLDLQFGDVGVLLNLDGPNSIAEILGQPSLSDDLVADTFLRHASGLRVLLAPDDLTVVENIESSQVAKALEQLRAYFDIIVCDLWSMYEHLTRDVIRMSDQVVLVTTPDLPALKGLRRVLIAGRDELHLDERAIVVVNRGAGKAGFSTSEVRKVLDRPAALTIPSDGAPIAEAVNRGLPLLDGRVRTKAAKSFHELAALVSGAARAPQGDLVAAKARP